MLHVGDLSYANGNPEIWDSFIEGLQPFAARLPYMIAVGNHEVGWFFETQYQQALEHDWCEYLIF
jgi:hypothetical protein